MIHGDLDYEHRTVVLSQCDLANMGKGYYRAHRNLAGEDGWRVVHATDFGDRVLFTMERLCAPQDTP